MIIPGEIQSTMRTFAENLSSILVDNLLSIMLFGSAVLGDFTPGKGDLDFLVTLQHDLSNEECSRIFALHDRMRTGEMGPFAIQLEGTYYPLEILIDPKNTQACGCYIGTGRKGWRGVKTNQNSLIDFAVIRQHGLVCYGRDIRPLVYQPTRAELLAEINRVLQQNSVIAEAAPTIEFALAMFHWGARALCYAATGSLCSKSHAAQWYASSYPHNRWASLVLHAVKYRYPLTESERTQVNPAISTDLHSFLGHIEEMLFQEQAKSDQQNVPGWLAGGI